MKRRQSGQVLIILVGALLLGGSGAAAGLFLTGKPHAELKKDALAIAKDQGRRKPLDAALRLWEKDVESGMELRTRNGKALGALFRQHDAKPADFDRLYAESDAIEARAFEAVLEVRFAVREQHSPAEWRA